MDNESKNVDYSEEEWRDVEGYQGIYQVSNKGRIRSLDRTIYNEKGNYYSNIKGKMLKLQTTVAGYHSVGLCKNGITTMVLVHRVVASTFIGNPDNLPEVDHLDACRTNNCVENLRFVTCKENAANRIRHYREKHPIKEKWEFDPNDIVKFDEVIWMPIGGYKGLYIVSSDGRVRSLGRLVSNGNGRKAIEGKELRQGRDHNGFATVVLRRDGKSHMKRVHRLVIDAFTVPIEGLDAIGHLNFDRTDNRIENLFRCPKGYQVARRIKNGLIDRNEKVSHLNTEEGKIQRRSARRRTVVRDDGKKYACVKDAADDINRSETVVYAVLRGLHKSSNGHKFWYEDELPESFQPPSGGFSI